jgi:hypothetical protein
MKFKRALAAAALSILTMAWLGAATLAQDGDPPLDAEALLLKQQISEAIQKQNAAVDAYNAALARVKTSAELTRLDQAADAALKVYNEAKTKTADKVGPEAERLAAARLRILVEGKLAAHADAKEGVARMRQIQKEQAAHEWQIVLARLQLDHPLSPINRALADDGELSALAVRVESASRSELDAAQAALDKAREEKLANSKESQQLHKDIDQADMAIEKLNREAAAIEVRLAPLRRAIEAAETARLQAEQPAASDVADEAKLDELHRVYEDAVEAYNTRAKEFIATDADAARWRKEYDDWAAKVNELRKRQK